MNANLRLGSPSAPVREDGKPAESAVARPALTTELMLVARLCQWPPANVDGAALREIARSADWTVVLAAARRHRVEGLVHAGLKAASIQPPAPVATALARRAAAIARENLVQTAESVRLADMLRERGIEPLFLKGVTLAMLAYGTLGVKHSRDIDLLVPPGQAMAAIAVLRRAGYELAEVRFRDETRLATAIKVLYEVEMRHAVKGTLVELHWRLFDFEHVLKPLHAPGIARAVPVGSFGLPTFGDLDLFAYLCVHGARHGWARLKWLADINALIARRDAVAIEALYAGAMTRGAGRGVAVTLLLCEELLGLALRPDFAHRLRADRWTSWLLALARDILGHPMTLDERPIAKMKLEAAQVLLQTSWRDARAVMSRQWTGTTERLAVPLPRRLFFLYGLIRPPLWLARRFRSLWSALRPRTRG